MNLTENNNTSHTTHDMKNSEQCLALEQADSEMPETIGSDETLTIPNDHHEDSSDDNIDDSVDHFYSTSNHNGQYDTPSSIPVLDVSNEKRQTTNDTPSDVVVVDGGKDDHEEQQEETHEGKKCDNYCITETLTSAAVQNQDDTTEKFKSDQSTQNGRFHDLKNHEEKEEEESGDTNAESYPQDSAIANPTRDEELVVISTLTCKDADSAKDDTTTMSSSSSTATEACKKIESSPSSSSPKSCMDFPLEVEWPSSYSEARYCTTTLNNDKSCQQRDTNNSNEFFTTSAAAAAAAKYTDAMLSPTNVSPTTIRYRNADFEKRMRGEKTTPNEDAYTSCRNGALNKEENDNDKDHQQQMANKKTLLESNKEMMEQNDNDDDGTRLDHGPIESQTCNQEIGITINDCLDDKSHGKPTSGERVDLHDDDDNNTTVERDLELQLIELKLALANAQTKLGEQQLLMVRISEERYRVTSELQTTMARNEELVEQNTMLQEQNEQLKRVKIDNTEEIKTLHNENTEYKNQVVNLESTVQDLTVTTKNQTIVIEQCRGEVEKLSRSHDRVSREHDTQKDLNKMISAALKAERQMVNDLQEKLGDMGKDKLELERELNQITSERDQLQSTLCEMKNERDCLARDVRTLDSMNDELNRLLDTQHPGMSSLRGKQNGGGQGTVFALRRRVAMVQNALGCFGDSFVPGGRGGGGRPGNRNPDVEERDIGASTRATCSSCELTSTTDDSVVVG